MTALNTTSAQGKSNRRGVICLIAVVAYLGVYIMLSLGGEYVGHNQGGQDNRESWVPAHCAELSTSLAGRQKLRLTVSGWLFLPPMLIDRSFIHRTHLE